MKVRHDRDSRPIPHGLLADTRLAELSAWGGRLAAAGLSPGESGNMSCRSGDGFLITRTGVPLAAIRTDDWVLVTEVRRLAHGEVVVNSIGPHEPSRDSAVHAAVYTARPDATTVFHFHVGSLEVLTSRLGVPATSAYYPAGTTESMEEIERFLSYHHAIGYFVLIDHGIVAMGDSIDDTGALIEAHQRAVEREA